MKYLIFDDETAIPHHTQNTAVSTSQRGACRSTADRPCRRSRQGRRAVPCRHSTWSTPDAIPCPARPVLHTPLVHWHILLHHTAVNTKQRKWFIHFLCLQGAWHSGRTLVFDWLAFPVLHSTCSWQVTTYVDKPSAIGQPTRPTQPFILLG